MKYYWSCWFTKEELIQYGATDLYPVVFWLSGMLIPVTDYNNNRDWCFIDNDGFDLFLKLTKDRSVAEISAHIFKSVLAGNNIKIDRDSRDGKNLRACSLDF